MVVEVMKEKSVDLAANRPTMLDDEMVKKADLIVTKLRC
ncbi:MAG: hypothetical protein HY619_02400 [Thaumarchaeota archaeon]|nr:hypothetical protein [Nitrososphaerota archaeon]